MTNSRLLLMDNELEHLSEIAWGLENQGFETKRTRTVAEARLCAKEKWAGTFVLDIRMGDADDPIYDHGGLEVIREFREEHPDSLIVVCSEVAHQYEKLALALGADTVITKSQDLRVTAFEIGNTVLRNGGMSHRFGPFSPDARRIIHYLVFWMLLPLALGIVASAASWHYDFRLPFLGLRGTANIPMFAAAIFILLAGDHKGRRDRLIGSWSVFVKFHHLRGWLLSAVGGGILFELLLTYVSG